MTALGYHLYQPACALEVTGEDARVFLQGQFSNDLSRLSSGELSYGLWLNRKGKIQADSFVFCCGEERFLVLSYHCSEELVRERLESYLIMEDAEIASLGSDLPAISVFGDGLQKQVMDRLGLDRVECNEFVETGGVLVFQGRRGAESVLECICIEDTGVDSVKGLVDEVFSESESLDQFQMTEIAAEGMMPRIGLEFGEQDLPQELGLHRDAVSFTKGCYLGQEVMARLHSMGKARNGLAKMCVENLTTVLDSGERKDLLDENGKRQGKLCGPLYRENGSSSLGIVSLAFEGEELFCDGVAIRVLERLGDK